MYTFLDKGNPPESLTLRPEGTAGCVRAMLEHNLLRGRRLVCGISVRCSVMKNRKRPLSSVSSVWGRNFWCSNARYGCRADSDDCTSVETYGVAEKVQLELNTLGEADERAAYRAALVGFLESHKADLDEDSQRRLTTNPTNSGFQRC